MTSASLENVVAPVVALILISEVGAVRHRPSTDLDYHSLRVAPSQWEAPIPSLSELGASSYPCQSSTHIATRGASKP
jgi:hypothetical protein